MNEFEKKISNYKILLDSKLKEVYNEGPTSLTHPINYVLSGIGKRFRPILTMIVTDMYKVPIDDIIFPSVSIEMLHNFTLIHDDIMDKDLIRHGKETVHKKWDINTAILSGDAMLAISLQVLMKNKLNNDNHLVKTFINGLLAVCEGQALDIEFENCSRVSLDDYQNMIYLKTAYMIGLSAEIGGILSNLEQQQISLLKEFGDSIGMAYQVQDDLLELFSDSDLMNKSLESDFLLKKKTFLWASIDTNDVEEFEQIVDRFISDKYNAIKDLKSFILNKGIKDKADSFVLQKINYANSLLEEIDVNTDFLYYYSNLIFNRGN